MVLDNKNLESGPKLVEHFLIKKIKKLPKKRFWLFYEALSNKKILKILPPSGHAKTVWINVVQIRQQYSNCSITNLKLFSFSVKTIIVFVQIQYN